jgi:hypothetical protein
MVINRCEDIQRNRRRPFQVLFVDTIPAATTH